MGSPRPNKLDREFRTRHTVCKSRQFWSARFGQGDVLPLLSGCCRNRKLFVDDFPSVHLRSQTRGVVGEWTAARHHLHVRLYVHCYRATGAVVKLIEGRTDTTEEAGEGCDEVEVGGRWLSDCGCSGSRAATTCRPTLLLLEALLLMLSGGFGDSSGEGLCWQQRAGVVGG
jgi:hypothetical protein